jgi:hypothetical protein
VETFCRAHGLFLSACGGEVVSAALFKFGDYATPYTSRISLSQLVGLSRLSSLISASSPLVTLPTISVATPSHFDNMIPTVNRGRMLPMA